MSETNNNVFSELTELSDNFVSVLRNTENKEQLRMCRVAFKNFFVNFETEFAKQQDKLDREQQKELEQLQAIKELLNK